MATPLQAPSGTLHGKYTAPYICEGLEFDDPSLTEQVALTALNAFIANKEHRNHIANDYNPPSHPFAALYLGTNPEEHYDEYMVYEIANPDERLAMVKIYFTFTDHKGRDGAYRTKDDIIRLTLHPVATNLVIHTY